MNEKGAVDRMDASMARQVRIGLAGADVYPTDELVGPEHDVYVQRAREDLRKLARKLDRADVVALARSAELMYRVPRNPKLFVMIAAADMLAARLAPG
jgi:hypothetical protein